MKLTRSGRTVTRPAKFATSLGSKAREANYVVQVQAKEQEVYVATEEEVDDPMVVEEEEGVEGSGGEEGGGDSRAIVYEEDGGGGEGEELTEYSLTHIPIDVIQEGEGGKVEVEGRWEQEKEEEVEVEGRWDGEKQESFHGEERINLTRLGIPPDQVTCCVVEGCTSPSPRTRARRGSATT